MATEVIIVIKSRGKRPLSRFVYVSYYYFPFPHEVGSGEWLDEADNGHDMSRQLARERHAAKNLATGPHKRPREEQGSSGIKKIRR